MILQRLPGKGEVEIAKYDFTIHGRSDDAEGERIAIPTGEENQDPVFLNCGKEM